jgi:hypothetical protein
MTRIDKLILWGAFAVMAAVGSLSIWKISQTPKVDPTVVHLEHEFRNIWQGPAVFPGPGPVPSARIAFLDPVIEARSGPDAAGSLRTRGVGAGLPHPIFDVRILPVPVIGTARADLDGAAFSWTVKDPEVALLSWMRRKEASPTGFIIRRQCGNGPVTDLAKVGPKDRSFTDLYTEPLKTYRYWVLVTGPESDLVLDPPVLKPATKGLNASAETLTPSAARVKLVGGDKDNAVLRVETYDRAQKKWIAGKAMMTVPGRGIGASGWTLKGLRFDNFTLVADVTDDGGVDRVLTTKD